MKIVIDQAIPFIEGRFPENTEVVSKRGDEIGPKDVEDADALIVRTRTRCGKALLKDSKVKLVATATIGTDHIDIDWCDSNGVEVRNAPGCNTPGVAQYVFASLFKTGFDPAKDTLGIIGYGHVGSIVADWARQMGIRILISDAPRKEAGFQDADYLEMEEVLHRADAVTLHVPFTKTGLHPTFHMIGEREFSSMKSGSLLINSSRGGVVDEKAWKAAIGAGKVRGVADVWENEPSVDPELLSLVEIATPHIAGYSEQGKKRATRMALQAVEEVLKIPVDLSGLECFPPQSLSLSPSLISRSYNPLIDTSALRNRPDSFEALRNSYHYRQEPLFLSE